MNMVTRIKKNITIDDKGCWLMRVSPGNNGYAKIDVRVDGKHTRPRAHRVSYETFVGPIPEGQLVCHKCDTPNCVNPEHLFTGTHKDNTQDMIKKGRNVKRKSST